MICVTEVKYESRTQNGGYRIGKAGRDTDIPRLCGDPDDGGREIHSKCT